MWSSCKNLLRSIPTTRGFCTSNVGDTIVASVLFERIRIVIPKIDPIEYAFYEFSSRWRQRFSRAYPDEFLKKSDSRGLGEFQMDYEPAPRITEADRMNDKRSLHRALDKKLYLLVYGDAYGTPSGKPVWHFPEKMYGSEDTLRKCAESALQSVLGDLSDTYFIGNAPMGHLVIQPTQNDRHLASFKRFFFKSQVIGKSKYEINNCEDFAWVTKDEVLEHFPEHAAYFNRMIIG